MKPICLYHLDCVDGFGAAYAVWWKFDADFDYYPLNFFAQIEDLPDIEGRDVLIVDLNFEPKVMEYVCKHATKVVMIDHHKTGYEQLDYLVQQGKMTAVFDNTKSGAMLTWEYFNGDPPPLIYKYIQDQDLNRWELPNSKEIFNVIASYPYEFEAWDQLTKSLTHELLREGQVLMRRYDRDLSNLIEQYAHWLLFDGVPVPAINVPRMYNAAATKLARDHSVPFAVAYHMVPEGLKISLRSRDAEKFSVRIVAEQHGGGGHDGAASFIVPMEEAAQYLIRVDDEG